jgi:formylglycine-generating enzyme required for sulfatase activity
MSQTDAAGGRAWSAENRIRAAAAFAVVIGVLLFVGARVFAPVPDLPPLWSDPLTGMEFVLVRPGSFRMGTPPDEGQREEGERPHTVQLTHAFYLGRYEVTQGEWQAVMGANPSAFADCGPRCPVETVSWFAVQAFIERLNARSRLAFRLPTEAEWEYACRAGGSEAFGRSSSLSSRDANIHGDFPYNAPKGTFRGQPTPVGYFKPNPWGFYDMSGNVWEWMQDAHCPYPDGFVTDPVGECASERKVIRGGSWLFDGASARCGLRYTHRPQDDGYSLGLRLAKDGGT